MAPEIRGIPEPTLRRLAAYHQLLLRMQRLGREVVSCTHIANDQRTDPTQVRKDLAFTGVRGRPKVGYAVRELIDSIETFFGWNNTTEAFLAGVGHLGGALLGYDGFAAHGLKIVAAFDIDPARCRGKVHGVPVMTVAKLPDLARRMRIQLGILTVPAMVAQEVADLMVSGGIRAIWNFAPIKLDLPDGVIVRDENLASTLAVLSRHLTAAGNEPTDSDE